MAITPRTELKLLKVPINIDDKNQITFSSKLTQYNYFNSLNKLEVDNFTYQRADSIIRYPAHIDDIITYNYCMYQNENYTDKWFYAFITGMRYINDKMTEITIKTDVYQTWMFDIEVKTSYVEREHVNDDTRGLNTYPEGLETGEYTIMDSYYTGSLINPSSNIYGYYTVFSSSWDPYAQQETSSTYGGVTCGSSYFVMGDSNSIRYFLNIMASQAKNDAIVGAFIVPRQLFYQGDMSSAIPGNWWSYGHESGGLAYYPYKKLDDIYLATLTKYNNSEALLMAQPTFYPADKTANNYTPKNNKLLTYPYSYIEINNNSGGQAILRYEDFDTSSTLGLIEFDVVGTITPGCSVTCIPLYYKNKTRNYEESLTMGKYPIASYQVDMYTNWLTQNSLSLNIGVGEQLLNIGGNLLTGNIGDAIGGAFGIGKTMAEVEKQKMVPPQTEGNTNNGDVAYASNNLGFTFYRKSIKKEYAEKLDNYFNMFGYRVNITKVPNVFGRTYFNYVKTIDVNIEGYIPQTDLQEIKDMFNNGVTFWHDTGHFLDYSVNNTIVS